DIRKEMGLQINDMLKIDVNNGQIIITKADDSCVFCGKTSKLKSYRGKTVCESCIKELNNS
ncbi:MAG: AbrB family transcriptional regulator, partial [Ruminococcus sp.]|nr:AbrB family transcriptional regulator [Ruminococcus sp.]